MKKIVSLALCAALACALLAGCGGGGSKKIPPENFPHSETLRMDATVDEVVKAENLKTIEVDDSIYDSVATTIDGTQFNAFFLAIPELDRMGITYSITEPSTDFEKVYEQFVSYFSKIYGETEEEQVTAPTDVLQPLKNKLWRYSFDGNEYIIEVQLQLVHEETQFLIIAAPAEILTM